MSQPSDIVIASSSQTVATATDAIVTINVSEGYYELVSAVISLSASFAQKVSLGFKSTATDPLTTHMMKEGWALNKNGVALDNTRTIKGPGQIYGTAKFDAANTLILLVQYRRLIW